MITQDNLTQVLQQLNFTNTNNIFTKKINKVNLTVDFNQQKIIYPTEITINDKTTCNFSANENFVVFECVHRLLEQGYQANHIELEKKWQLGHSQKSGKADICVKDNDDNIILIIECKTAGSEYTKAKNILENDPRNQLFSYLQQATTTQFLALYASDFVDNQLSSEYYLIATKDNLQLLADNKNLKGYKDTATTQQKWQVWCDTYDQEYATIGLFENNRPYEIGKDKFNRDDLQIVNNKDIQKIHHKFASVLRKYSLDEKETAFNVLVNLFLCKATDENINPEELQCYWKGKAYDNPFDFQDRLQKLYQKGMKDFLDEDITYITREQIEEEFAIFGDDPSVIKDHILEHFKQQKFFSSSSTFSLIEVNNEKRFYQNFYILLDIFKIIQNISLTGSEENQLLGDLFEIFLDGGVQQSEGMFFTPMPIVKFIISSLPHKNQPKVIDYACGAGHFLNEYARYNKDCTAIIGIDKSHRLAKISKVSSYMYNNKIDIITNDALVDNPKVQDNDFDVLIANPPYSVKGFLETLSEEQRAKFTELNPCVSNISTGKYIECFFIEKAKQILKKDAVMGIVLPSSILNKTENIYSTTREIILKHFYIYAIAQLPSETFGKTGTNTVTLFLQRKDPKADLDIHYKNMAHLWINNKFETNELHKDNWLLASYCDYLEIDFELYKQFLADNLSDELLQVEMFSEYQKAYAKLSKANQKKYKNLVEFIKEKEEEKLYFYCLAKTQKNEVIIVLSPDKKSDAKKFLGYEWSNRKGNEGIQYLASVDIDLSIDKDELEDNEKRALENQQGLKYINTPLYNPSDSDDMGKINKIIKDNFNGIKTAINEDLGAFVSRAKLEDMLDFDRVDFGKTLNLNPKKKIEIKSKWDLKRLGDICVIISGQSPKSDFYNENKKGLPFYQGKTEFTKKYIQNPKIYTSEITKTSIQNDILMSVRAPVGTVNINPFEKICIGRGLCAIRGNEQISQKYLFVYLQSIENILSNASNSGAIFQSISRSQLENFKIPLPPLEIQQKIIDEIEILENEEKENATKIENLKNEISTKLNNLYHQSEKEIRLTDDCFIIGIGKRVLKKEIREQGKYPIYSANVFEPFGYTDKELLTDFSMATVIWGIDGDWSVNVIAKNQPFYPTDHCGYLRVKNEEIEPIYIAHCLEKAGIEKRFSRTIRASIDRISDIKIPLPPLAEQQKIVAEIEKIETQIKTLEEKLQKIPTQKEQILKEYL